MFVHLGFAASNKAHHLHLYVSLHFYHGSCFHSQFLKFFGTVSAALFEK